jgi:transcription elongation factor GreA
VEETLVFVKDVSFTNERQITNAVNLRQIEWSIKKKQTFATTLSRRSLAPDLQCLRVMHSKPQPTHYLKKNNWKVRLTACLNPLEFGFIYVSSGFMAEEKFPMTVHGKKLLDEELKHLTTVERPTIVKAIEIARGHGDLSENADYSAAKERQGFIEGRIQDINGKLARAQVIDPLAIKSDKIVFGATVVLEDQETSKQMTYKIVGVDEANIKSGKISITSPLARALISKAEGDEVVVHAPKGQIYYNVVKIEYV